MTENMEDSNLKDLLDKELLMKTSKGAGVGLAVGSVCGVMFSMLHDGPQVGTLPWTAKVCGQYAAATAVAGATYIGIEHTLEKYRTKKDYINGAVAGALTGFGVGSLVTGGAGPRIRCGLMSGTALALTSLLLDYTGMKTTEEEEKKTPLVKS